MYAVNGFEATGSHRFVGSYWTVCLRSCGFCVEIVAKADGYLFDWRSVPKVPLVTEQLVVATRRFMRAMCRTDGQAGFEEKNDISLPSSHGNALMGIDIVLQQSAAGAQ